MQTSPQWGSAGWECKPWAWRHPREHGGFLPGHRKRRAGIVWKTYSIHVCICQINHVLPSNYSWTKYKSILFVSYRPSSSWVRAHIQTAFQGRTMSPVVRAGPRDRPSLAEEVWGRAVNPQSTHQCPVYRGHPSIWAGGISGPCMLGSHMPQTHKNKSAKAHSEPELSPGAHVSATWAH